VAFQIPTRKQPLEATTNLFTKVDIEDCDENDSGLEQDVSVILGQQRAASTSKVSKKASTEATVDTQDVQMRILCFCSDLQQLRV
jgi:hypothetical protein